jgi:hypothetical protein
MIFNLITFAVIAVILGMGILLLMMKYYDPR